MRSATKLLAPMVPLLLIAAAACGGDDDSGASGTEREPGTSTETAAAATGGSTATAGAAGGSSSTGSASGAPDDVDPNGVLRTYYDLVTNGGPEFDPAKARISTEQFPQDLVYGSLFTIATDGTFQPNLALSAEVVDPSTVTVELRPDVTFSDGSPLDAEAMKFSIERQRDAQNPVLAAELQQISDVTVESPTEFTVHLASPIAGSVHDLLPLTTFAAVPPAAVQAGHDLSREPIGAGPFLLDSYEPGRAITYVKNPRYYNADQVRLAGIEILHTELGQAQVTAIRSNSVDASGELFTYAQSKEIADSGWEIETYLGDNVMVLGQMCKSRPPFDDVRVRQALNYAIDRDAINAAVLDGKGAPMWGLFPPDHPLHDAELDGHYAYDPDTARALLAEAGQSDLEFDSFFVQSERISEIVQANLADVGVTMNILPYTAGGQEFYPDGATAEMNLLRLARSGLAKVSRTLMPPSVGNVCNYDDPDLNALVQEIQGLAPTDPRYSQAWDELQELVADKALNLAVVFEPSAIAWNPDRIGDPAFELNLRGERIMDFEKVYIRS